MKMKNNTLQPMKLKWNGTIDKELESPLGLNGLILE